ARELPGGLPGERALPAVGDLLVNLEQRFLEVAMLLRARVFFEFERDAGPFGQSMHRFGKTDALEFLNEREYVTALVTAEAMKNLTLGMDVKTRRLLLVKRAEGDKIGARALEREIGADDLDDVAGSADLLECCRRKKSSHEVT